MQVDNIYTYIHMCAFESIHHSLPKLTNLTHAPSLNHTQQRMRVHTHTPEKIPSYTQQHTLENRPS